MAGIFVLIRIVMQITEQIIQRIARQVFNQMFPSSLRQSGAVISGSGSSVQYAAEAGHASTADSASSASSVPWTGVSGRPTKLSDFTNDVGYITGVSWTDVSGRPTKLSDFTNDVVSASKSGSTLTVTIAGTSYSLTDTDTWRPVQDNLTSTSTTDCLSAKQGSVLKGYIDTLNGYFDADGNAKSALKLTTVSKTAWGQTYWTSGGVPDSISGDMTSVGDISFSASGKKIGGFLYFDTTNYRLGVGTSSPQYRLHVDGQIYSNNSMLVVNSEAAVHVGSSTSNRISLHWSTADGNNRGLYDSSSAWLIATNGTNSFLMRGNVGIGTDSPQYKLHVSGTIYATGSITEQSDIRNKDVESYTWAPALSAIADAPIAIYTMKDDKEQRRRVGSIAQYWQKAMPEAVCEAADGTLSMNYGEIGLVSVIALAREVRNLKAQIEMLKRR